MMFCLKLEPYFLIAVIWRKSRFHFASVPHKYTKYLRSIYEIIYSSFENTIKSTSHVCRKIGGSNQEENLSYQRPSLALLLHGLDRWCTV